MTKTYLLDTNVLVYSPTSMFAFKDNEVVIPLVVLDELDKLKTGMSQAAVHARMAIRYLDELRAIGNLHDGVLTESGGKIRVELNCSEQKIVGLDASRADNRIINIALNLQEEHKDRKLTIITKDINLRVKCDALEVNAEDYISDSVAESLDDLYKGHSQVFVDGADIDVLHASGTLPVKNVSRALYPNEYVQLVSNTDSQHTSLAKFDGVRLEKIKMHKNIWGISPRNREQIFVMDALFDPEVSLVTITGSAGVGKTILGVAAAVSQLLDSKQYNKIILTRPLIPFGPEIGFLKGTLYEKMTPWIAALFDAMEVVFSEKGRYFMDSLIDEGKIEVQALTHIRGRSLPKSFIIVDEAQLISKHEVKTIISRTGAGSKIVLAGDVCQMSDTPFLRYNDSGLSCVAEAFKQEKIAAHIQLVKGERSELATLAAKIL